MHTYKEGDRILMAVTHPEYSAFSHINGGLRIGEPGVVVAINLYNPEELSIELDRFPNYPQYVHPKDIMRAGEEHAWRVKALEIYKASVPPVWHKEKWWTHNTHRHEDHYVHKSVNNPTMLAYFQSPEKAARGIATQIKPGRYLSLLFRDFLSEKDIAMYASWQIKGSRESIYGDLELKFAKDPDDIVDVYSRGPYSCMAEMDCVEVYGAGDLAVAYLEQGKKIWARALCWPEKKIYSRLYPTREYWLRDGFSSAEDSETCQAALENKLRELNYTFDRKDGNGLDGAKIFIKKDRNGYVMPYIDHQYKVQRHSEDFWILSRNRGIECDRTDGTLPIDPEDEDDDYRCDNCAEYSNITHEVVVSLSGNGTRATRCGYWCDTCFNLHTFYCSGIHAHVSAEEYDKVEVNDCNYSSRYAASNFYFSAVSRTWFDPERDEKVILPDGRVCSQAEANDLYQHEHGTIEAPEQMEAPL